MPFTHHSHSGQFCPGHAKNSLEEIIQTAIARNMELLCLTEHMPRGKEDFYPEEVRSCLYQIKVSILLPLPLSSIDLDVYQSC